MDNNDIKCFSIFQCIIIIYWNTKWCTSLSSNKCDSVWSRIIINTSSCGEYYDYNSLKELNSPKAVMFSFDTCTVISVDDGLLRTSTGCAD